MLEYSKKHILFKERNRKKEKEPSSSWQDYFSNLTFTVK